MQLWFADAHKLRSRIAGLVAALVTGIAMLGAGVGPAAAHDLVVDSTPKQGSKIEEPVKEISLTFSGVPKEGFNRIALSRDGDVLFTGEPDADGRVLSIEVSDDVDWQPGEYTVGYQITSSDGHATRGSLQFQYGDVESSDSSSSEQSEETGSEGLGVPTWIFGVTSIVVIAGALVLAIARWRDISK
ncbi:copper resistance CopC family protein [Corynebacterium sp. MSK039]|nr:copper resistance CopC family protein [Corynebacterium sp. MSK039]